MSSWLLAQLLHLCFCSCLYSCHLTYLPVFTISPFLQSLAHILFSFYTIQPLVITSSSDLSDHYLALDFATCIEFPGVFLWSSWAFTNEVVNYGRVGNTYCTTHFVLALGFAKNNNNRTFKMALDDIQLFSGSSNK